MKNMSTVPVYANEKLNANANEKHEYSALYTYLMQMKNMSIVPCIHT